MSTVSFLKITMRRRGSLLPIQSILWTLELFALQVPILQEYGWPHASQLISQISELHRALRLKHAFSSSMQTRVLIEMGARAGNTCWTPRKFQPPPLPSTHASTGVVPFGQSIFLMTGLLKTNVVYMRVCIPRPRYYSFKLHGRTSPWHWPRRGRQPRPQPNQRPSGREPQKKVFLGYFRVRSPQARRLKTKFVRFYRSMCP